MQLLGKRWTGLILFLLLEQPLRFSELARAVPGLSDRLLSQRLKELEACDLIERKVYDETPVRVEYSLTPAGRDLREALHAVQDWAHRWNLQCNHGQSEER